MNEPDPNRKTCYVCRRPIDRETATYGEKDAFCSANCARAYFGTEAAPPGREKMSA